MFLPDLERKRRLRVSAKVSACGHYSWGLEARKRREYYRKGVSCSGCNHQAWQFDLRADRVRALGPTHDYQSDSRMGPLSARSQRLIADTERSPHTKPAAQVLESSRQANPS